LKIRAGVRVLIVFPLYLLPCRERVTVLCRAPRCVFVCVCVCLCVYSRVGASCVGCPICVCVVLELRADAAGRRGRILVRAQHAKHGLGMLRATRATAGLPTHDARA